MLRARLRPILLSSQHGVRFTPLCRRCLATMVASYNNVHPAPLTSQSVRTRFAPSPTGQLHLGSLRTALFNFLLARHYNGRFILRIEDTDRDRTVVGAEEEMYRLLKWAGIDWDEGPVIGGVHGPYRQSERLKIYSGLSNSLIDSNRAYRCFCTKERLDSLRVEARKYRQQGSYDRECYAITAEESRDRAHNNEPHVVRLVAPTTWPIVNDYLHGGIQFPSSCYPSPKAFFDDIILLKADGWPTYHLACVIDDHLMEISHVIRGEEWLPSTPKHLVLYEAFGWKSPVFIHLPLLQSKNGRKLSKRDANKESYMIRTFEEDGILPEALNNYVALYGWSPKTKSEVLTMDELIARFSLDGLTVGNLRLSSEKLPFLNHKHILQRLSTEEGTRSLVASAISFLQHYLPPSEMPSEQYVEAVLKASQERMHTLKDIYNAGSYFFTEPNYSHPTVIKYRDLFYQRNSRQLMGNWDQILVNARKKLSVIPEWTAENITKAIQEVGEESSMPVREIMRILRYALAALDSGVGIIAIIEILGKERVYRRLESCRPGLD